MQTVMSIQYILESQTATSKSNHDHSTMRFKTVQKVSSGWPAKGHKDLNLKNTLEEVDAYNAFLKMPHLLHVTHTFKGVPGPSMLTTWHLQQHHLLCPWK